MSPTLFAAVVIAIGAPAIAIAHPMDVTPLNNKDILQMVERKVSAEKIVQTIKYLRAPSIPFRPS